MPTKIEKEYEILYTKQFIIDIEMLKKADQKSILTKINNLVNELREHPTTGTGKPEALIGDKKGLWSRRINRKHRLIYEIDNDIVTVILLAAFGHYGDK